MHLARSKCGGCDSTTPLDRLGLSRSAFARRSSMLQKIPGLVTQCFSLHCWHMMISPGWIVNSVLQTGGCCEIYRDARSCHHPRHISILSNIHGAA
ncbi:hypothetical protein PM082_018711 [Marasmius tenuissimus]|nr:hypothetical protein PM082_018711 [Marasmius tenuissimus]